MAYKYKAKKKMRKPQGRMNTGIQNKERLIGKGKIWAMLISGTIIVAGIYITAVKLRFEIIFHIYWVLTSVLLCTFIYLKQRRDYLYAECTKNGQISQEDVVFDRKRRIHIKYLLLVLIPFLLTVIGDVVYLVFLRI